MKKQNSIEEIKKDTYRYVCDACTNTAFTSPINTAGERRQCKSCNKAFVTKKENYIKI